MADYLLGDMPITSAPQLSLLRPRRSGPIAATLTVTRVPRPRRPRAVRAWHHQWQDDAKRAVISLARTRSGYLLRFPRQCDFAISSDAGRIEPVPHRRVAPEFLGHLLADQVLPRCLAQRGELVVHAAGIALGPDIALFVGESGRGKSTLAGLLFRSGRTLLSDDCLILRPTREAVRAVPTYPSLRLRPDSADALFPGDSARAPRPACPDKSRFSVPDVSREASAGRVAAVYFLGDADAGCADVRVTPMARAAACIRLMEQSFQLDVLDGEAVGRLLGLAGQVLARVPAFTLDYPRDFSRAAALAGGIERHFAGVAGDSPAA
jgi:hypothetical protein